MAQLGVRWGFIAEGILQPALMFGNGESIKQGGVYSVPIFSNGYNTKLLKKNDIHKFFIHYLFCILAIMFERLLKSHKYRDHASVSSYSIKELRDMCDILNEYCKDNIGYKKHKGLPTFSVRKDYSGNYYGQYCPTKHKINIYYNNIDSLKKFVGTFIHEYTHSVQNLRYYSHKLINYGYTQHPDEIEARNMELLHYKSCLKYLRSKI